MAAAATPRTPEKVMCRYGKECRKMATCTFPHECPYFRTSTGCRFGEKCRNVHPADTSYRPEVGEEYLADPDRLAYAAAAADDPSLLVDGVSPSAASPSHLAAAKERVNARFDRAVKLIQAAHCVALCFVLDTTGSMKPQMEAVKDQVTEIAKTLKTNGCDLRYLAFVGYKDWSDGDDHFEVLPFTQKSDDFVRFVGKIKAGGGGDTPEDVLGGLACAANLAWPEDSSCRVIFHLCDAPPHGRKFYTGSDEYPEGHPKDMPVEQLFRLLASRDITYFFGELNEMCGKMKEVFSAAAGRDISEMVFNNRALASIGPTVAAAARRTATSRTAHIRAAPVRPASPSRAKPVEVGDIDLRGAGGPGSGGTYAPADGPELQRKYVMDEARPSDAFLDALPELRGMTLDMDIPENFDFLRLNKTLALTTKATSVRVAPNPFASGSIRLAYYGRSIFRKGGDMKAKPDEEDIVLKEYMTLSSSPQLDLARYIVDLETQTVAAMLAFSYHKALAKALKRDPPFRVKYLKTHVVALLDPGRRYKRIMSTEKLFRDGMTMVKYTNNYNAVNWDGIGVPASVDRATWHKKVEFLVALSHFSWEFSEQQLLVADLQGIEAKGEHKQQGPPLIVLTDPAVHCMHENRFGVTNLRKIGIIGFFQTHKCNEFCRALGLQGSEA
eukprot:m.48112 g.48112  ORF g.48112 m.48112 type:complete len:668 (+) comp11342_c0_seq1:196-2199(+)